MIEVLPDGTTRTIGIGSENPSLFERRPVTLAPRDDVMLDVLASVQHAVADGRSVSIVLGQPICAATSHVAIQAK